MMDLSPILDSYNTFIETQLKDRFVKHRDLVSILSNHASTTAQEVVGHSVEGRELILLRLGNGPMKGFLWSQMHGDETTGTMAIMDLLNFLKHPAFASIATEILSSCTLYLLPMVNPDGAERFTRRNAQQLDINRDYLAAKSTEAKILKAVHANIQPDFGFNLHDQSDLWGVQHTTNPAAVSFLAPAFDEGCSLNHNRTHAMQVIACMKASLEAQLPGKMGLFDDTYEPRAFGDNFQASGTATILIEGGTIIGDVEAQQVRKMVFGATLAGLKAISSAAYEAVPLDNYFNIPKNSKTLFHFIIHDIEVNGLKTSVGINYKPSPGVGGTQVDRFYTIEDIGDLHTMSAHEVFEAGTLQLEGSIVYDEPANFSLLRGKEPVLSFKNGILQSKVIF
jgi:predicted deacylase